MDVIVEGGYIRVVQDVRGKYGSEGDYVMNRPFKRPAESHAGGSFDRHLRHHRLAGEEHSREQWKVGILGISYDGFTPLMALVNPHPALKVSVPMNPMVDGWMGDDWFHNGAFSEIGLSYIYEQQATRDNSEKWWTGHFDDYDVYMEAGSAGELAQRHGMEQIGFWRKILAHPSYDAFWRDQAMDKILAAQPLKVPVCWWQACGIRRTSTARWRSTKRSSRKTRPTTKSFWLWARGFTDRRSATALLSAR